MNNNLTYCYRWYVGGFNMNVAEETAITITDSCSHQPAVIPPVKSNASKEELGRETGFRAPKFNVKFPASTICT